MDSRKMESAMSHRVIDEEMVKVLFKLEPFDGYPPFEWERLRTKRIPDGRFLVCNIPYFVNGVSCGDVIQVDHVDDKYIFSRVLEYCGQSTIRIAPDESCDLVKLQDNLSQLGCVTEYAEAYGMLAVTMPDIPTLEKTRALLRIEQEQGRLDYEESAVYGQCC